VHIDIAFVGRIVHREKKGSVMLLGEAAGEFVVRVLSSVETCHEICCMYHLNLVVTNFIFCIRVK